MVRLKVCYSTKNSFNKSSQQWNTLSSCCSYNHAGIAQMQYCARKVASPSPLVGLLYRLKKNSFTVTVKATLKVPCYTREHLRLWHLSRSIDICILHNFDTHVTPWLRLLLPYVTADAWRSRCCNGFAVYPLISPTNKLHKKEFLKTEILVLVLVRL